MSTSQTLVMVEVHGKLGDIDTGPKARTPHAQGLRRAIEMGFSLFIVGWLVLNNQKD